MAEHTNLQFGRKRTPPPSAKRQPADRSPSPERTLLWGAVTAAVCFIVALSGGTLAGDGARAEAALTARPVMSTAVEEGEEAFSDISAPGDVREILRESIRDASGEPFGYMGGKWNLWEYLGDVMADLLIGG